MARPRRWRRALRSARDNGPAKRATEHRNLLRLCHTHRHRGGDAGPAGDPDDHGGWDLFGYRRIANGSGCAVEAFWQGARRIDWGGGWGGVAVIKIKSVY